MKPERLADEVDALPPKKRDVYDAVAAYGPISGPDLRDVVKKSNTGYTARLNELKQMGLVRRREGWVYGGRVGGMWEITPAADVEKERSRPPTLKEITRSIDEAKRRLRQVEEVMYGLKAGSLPIPYWSLLDTAIMLATEIVKALPDDYFEEPKENVLSEFRSADTTIENAAKLREALEARLLLVKLDATANHPATPPDEAEVARKMAAAKRAKLNGAS